MKNKPLLFSLIFSTFVILFSLLGSSLLSLNSTSAQVCFPATTTIYINQPGSPGTPPPSVPSPTPGESYWRLSGSRLYPASTTWNIGIGTTTPRTKLHIVAGNEGNLRIDSGDNNILYIGHDRDVGDWIQFRPENALGLSFLKGPDSPAMVITNVGNIGIGTTNPTQKLHIEGNTYVGGNLGIGTTTPVGKLDIWGKVTRYVYTLTRTRPMDDFSNYPVRCSCDKDEYIRECPSVLYEEKDLGSYCSDWYYPILSSGLRQSIEAAIYNKSEPQIIIDPFFVVQNNGYIGIGTINPIQKLHVEGGVYIAGNVGIGTTTPKKQKLYVVNSSTDQPYAITAKSTFAPNKVQPESIAIAGSTYDYSDNPPSGAIGILGRAVRFEGNIIGKYGVYGSARGFNAYAGFFDGNVSIWNGHLAIWNGNVVITGSSTTSTVRLDVNGPIRYRTVRSGPTNEYQVCVDDRIVLIYERKDSIGRIYISGADPNGNNIGWNCGGDPGFWNESNGKVKFYEWDWSYVLPGAILNVKTGTEQCEVKLDNINIKSPSTLKVVGNRCYTARGAQYPKLKLDIEWTNNDPLEAIDWRR